jgi:hypothetical protein
MAMCVLCVGKPAGCKRCHGTGNDPDPLAPALEDLAAAGAR